MARTTNDDFDCSFLGEDKQQVAASMATLALAAATSSVVATSTTEVMTGREEEKDKKGKVKNSHFSKQEGLF